MTTTESRLLCFVDERLDHMLDAPQMWGASESVELQILQLLEMRVVIVEPSTDPPPWQSVQIDYERFITEHLPNARPATLSALLGNREGDLISLLRQFVAEQRVAHASADVLARRNADEIKKIEVMLTLLASSTKHSTTTGTKRGASHARPVRVLEKAVSE